MSTSPSPIKGIIFKLISCFLFTCMAAIVRGIGEQYPAGQVVFCRNFFALFIVCAIILRSGEWKTLIHTHRPFGHFYRALAGVTAIFCMFTGLRYLPLPDSTAISYAQPIFSVIFAAILLKETVNKARWMAVCLGLIGVLIMLSPHISIFNAARFASAPGSLTTEFNTASQDITNYTLFGAIITLIGAILASLALTQVRALAKTERASTIVLYFTFYGTLLSSLTLPFGFELPRSNYDALMLISVGLVGGLGQMFLTQSYRYADASLVAPFDYTSMIYAVLIGYVVFGELPTLMVLIGAGLVIASGLFVIWRERVNAKKQNMLVEFGG